jgi:hypothetical protein
MTTLAAAPTAVALPPRSAHGGQLQPPAGGPDGGLEQLADGATGRYARLVTIMNRNRDLPQSYFGTVGSCSGEDPRYWAATPKQPPMKIFCA